VNPWDNHHRYAPIVVPIGSSLSFVWENDDHGVYLLNQDQCPTNFTTVSITQVSISVIVGLLKQLYDWQQTSKLHLVQVQSTEYPLCSQNGALGQEELYPVTTKKGGRANYTTTLNNTGIYYFTCQVSILKSLSPINTNSRLVLNDSTSNIPAQQCLEHKGFSSVFSAQYLAVSSPVPLYTQVQYFFNEAASTCALLVLQQGVHCLQGQRLEVTVYNYTQGLPGTVAQYPPDASTSTAPSESHVQSGGK